MPITGCAYYPEHWSRDQWEEDAQNMREAGLSVVRVGEFAWDKMEPSPGVYDFAWLDEVVEILARAGLNIVMCTPTPTPPPWLTHKHPEICRVHQDGVRVSPGARRQACANVPAYLDYSRRIVEEIVGRYGDHPAIIAWQIDNEFGCGETTRCYCKYCHAAFHQWLKEKYKTLEVLNAAWGTQFWGMTYRDWAHIPIPGITTEPQNPGMRLDYRRFSSDSWVRFQHMQIHLLRPHIGARLITHNFMIRHWSLDYWKLAQDLDFVSYDNYPHGLSDPAEVAMNLDLMRSFKRRNFWVIEQQPGPVNWHPYNPPVPPGQVRLWTHQAIAHGADAVVFFRYRAGRFGQEQYHRGLLKWDRSKDQAFYEAQQVVQDIKEVPEFSHLPAKTGIVFDYSDLWSIEMEPHQQEFSYWTLVTELYRAFWQSNVPVDFLPRGADLTGYEQVVVPAAILTHAGEAEKWRQWVEAGGRLIITFRTGVREPGNISVEEPLPAGMTELIGARVKDFFTVPPASYTAWQHHRMGTQIQAVADDKARLDYRLWLEILEPTQAHPLFVYADGYIKDKAAITVHKLGKGEVIYIGCWVDFTQLARQQGWIPAQDKACEEIILRGSDGALWKVKMNHHPDRRDGVDGFDVIYEKV